MDLEWFSISKTQKDVCDGFEINANHNHRISPQNGGLKSNFQSLSTEEYSLQKVLAKRQETSPWEWFSTSMVPEELQKPHHTYGNHNQCILV